MISPRAKSQQEMNKTQKKKWRKELRMGANTTFIHSPTTKQRGDEGSTDDDDAGPKESWTEN